ncbi:hypothetical protein [Niveibacterium terrae]|uniref:hypothetical protein n=1 Tax=Niveibacterium terrae TaxID=3373598 RepID=UPI003A8CE690
MSDRAALNEREVQAREALVELASAMLCGRESFFEGAVQLLRLKPAVGGTADSDPDFDVFVAIESETDHLPLQAQQNLWSAEALSVLLPEFERTERWAAEFAPAACRSLIERFRKPAE